MPPSAASAGRAPLACALRGAAIGETRLVTLPGGEKEWDVVGIDYPAAATVRA